MLLFQFWCFTILPWLIRCGLSSHPFYVNLHCHPLLISLIWIPRQPTLENKRVPATVSLEVLQDLHRYCKHYKFWKQIAEFALKSHMYSRLFKDMSRRNNTSKPEATSVTFSLDERYVVTTGRKNWSRRKSSIFRWTRRLLSLNAVLTACTCRVKESIKGLKFLNLMNLTASYSKKVYRILENQWS